MGKPKHPPGERMKIYVDSLAAIGRKSFEGDRANQRHYSRR